MTVHIVIPYRAGDSARDASFAVVARWWTDFTGGDLIACDDPDPDRFNRGRAINAGVRRLLEHVAGIRSDDFLVAADADLIPSEHAVAECIGRLHAQPGRYAYAVPFAQVEYVSRAATSEVHAGANPWAPGIEIEGVWDRLSTGGITIVTVHAWALAQGFDPRFHGWGFEDAAFDIAARTLTGTHPFHRHGSTVRHLWHPRPAEQDAGDAGYQASLALCHRYEDADGNPDALGALLRERQLAAPQGRIR